MNTLLRLRITWILSLSSVILLTGLAFFGCEKEGENKNSGSASHQEGMDAQESGLPREKTLYVGGFQWSDPNTFNPLHDYPAFPISGNVKLMYESPLFFNPATGKLEPFLTELYEKNNDIISLLVNPKAKWSDGLPVTADDIYYTIDLGRIHKGSVSDYVWKFITKMKIDSISVEGSPEKRARLTLTLNKKRNNPLAVLDYLVSVRIVAKHYFEPLFKSVGESMAEIKK